MAIDKVVLITGASQGIGLATAKELAEGYQVYASCRNPEKAEELQELSNKYNNVKIIKLNVDSESSVKSAVDEILKETKAIHILINNAGVGIYGPAETNTIDEAQKIFNTNFFGPLRTITAVVPSMRKQRYGRIINIGDFPSKDLSIYAASKAALESLTAADAQALRPFGIKYSLILPGPVATNFESHTTFGSRFKASNNPYGEGVAGSREKWKAAIEDGQSPSDVARIIREAIEAPEPKLWYITSLKAKDVIKEHYKDYRAWTSA